MEVDVGDALGWAFRDPRWRRRLAGMGAICLVLWVTCIGVIPASIALNGWMLAAADNLDSGRWELPAPGLYLRRGTPLFLVQVAYLGLLLLVAGSLGLIALRLGDTGSGSVVVAGMLAVTANGIAAVGAIVLAAAVPFIAVATERRGIAGGFDIPAIVAGFRADPGLGVMLGLLSLLALDIISPIGALLCVVGLAATTPYAYAVLAAGVSRWRRQQELGGKE